MATVGLPLTGVGDATALVATDNIGGEHYQRMKIHDGLDGSTRPLRVLATTPGAADGGVVTRPIASTAFNQAVVGAVGLTSGSSAVGITSGSSAVELTSAGSTRVAARFTVDNPTTSVSLSSQATVTVGNPTTSVTLTSGSTATIIGAAVLSSGSTSFLLGAVSLGGGSSTNMLGQVQATGTTKVDSSTKVDVSSGVILGVGSSANMLGTIVVSSGTTAITVGSVALLAGSSANMLGTIVVSSGTTAITVGSVALLAGTSANIIGAVANVAGTTAITLGSVSLLASTNIVGSVYEHVGVIGSSGTRIATSVDVALVSTNTARLGLSIFNETTGSLLYIGLSTAAVTSAAYTWQIPAGAGISFGVMGALPNHIGAVRGRLQSTTLAGIAVVSSWTT